MPTKKVKSAGRFGPRYGRRMRVRISAIDKSKNGNYVCPTCTAPRVNREAAGIWECRKCGIKFAGGAYTPSIKAGK